MTTMSPRRSCKEKKAKKAKFDADAFNVAYASGDYAACVSMIQSLNPDGTNIQYALDAAMMQHMTGDWASSQAGLDAASAQITEEFKSIRAETGAGGMLNDNLHNYMANSYELLVTDVFNALNYYNQGDLDNAHATLRMLEERQQQYEGIYGNILEEEQPNAESQSSMDNALKTAGLDMNAIMNNGGTPKKPTERTSTKTVLLRTMWAWSSVQ